MIYVYIDCNKIQDYVFSSQRLRGIRNGSRAIDEADQQVGRLVSESSHLIRALGGVIVAKFNEKSEADQFVMDAANVYGGYGIGTEWETIEVNDETADFYTDVLTPLLAGIRRKKDCPKQPLMGPPSSILATCCEVSGRGSAQHIIRQMGKIQRANSCERSKWNMEEADSLSEALLSPWEKYPGIVTANTAEGVVGWNAEKSFEVGGKEIPGTSEERLIGMVLADVNSLGSLLPELAKDESLFKSFVSGLRDCLRESLGEAIQAVLETAYVKRMERLARRDIALPFKLLFLGGDDLCFMTVGAYALPLTQKFIEIFEDRSSQLLAPFRNSEGPTGAMPKALTASAGVVLAPYSYPILPLRRLCQGLEKRAKNSGRAWAKTNGHPYPPSLVDFHLVKNDVAGNIGAIRKFSVTSKAPFAGISKELYGGPYLAGGNMDANPPPEKRFVLLNNLFEACNQMNSMNATGKLKDLFLLLRAKEAPFLYKDWCAHLGKDPLTLWNSACKLLDVPANQDKLPFKEIPRNTAILDALDLRPFEGLRKRWETSNVETY